MKDLSIYVHVPFCIHKCIYCDFYSIASYELSEEYLEQIRREITEFGRRFSGEYMVKSIFFGGGTPSSLSTGQIESIFNEIVRNFSISEDAEITTEANPGTVSRAKMAELRRIFNRISLGVQTFDDPLLRFLGRIHDSKEAGAAVIQAAESGFNNISLDLMFDIPGQRMEQFLGDLRTAVSLPVSHISAYSLILEEGTALCSMVKSGKLTLTEPDPDMYLSGIKYLSSQGFYQYEVSNFSRPGFECRHNMSYWTGKDYLGFGPSAHSLIEGRRFWNFRNLEQYIDGVREKGTGLDGEEILTKGEKFEEFVYLSLRSRGLGLDRLESKGEIIAELLKNGLAVSESGILRLTPEGYALADEIATELLK